MTQPTPEQHRASVARLRQFFDEDRLIRSAWHETDDRGRELACWAGALGADIFSEKDACKAVLAPAWFIEMLPSFDDSTSEARWAEFTARYVTIMGRVADLSPEASDRARDRSLIASLEVAKPHDTSGVVEPMIELLRRRIAGENVDADMKKARATAAGKAAWAAWAAAWAAEAWATRAAAAWAAKAAETAETATWAATWAEKRAAEAEAERAAWDTICDKTLSALEGELGIKETAQ